MDELLRILLIVVLPLLILLAGLVWWIRRMNTPPEMRWPQRNRRGQRRSERDVKIPPEDD